MLPVADKCGMYQLCVAIQWQDGTSLLWFAASFYQFHVGIFCSLVGEDPGVELAPFLCSAFSNVGAHIFQSVILFLLRTIITFFFYPGRKVDRNFIVELVLGVVAVACALLCHRVGTMAVVLTGDGNLCGKCTVIRSSCFPSS